MTSDRSNRLFRVLYRDDRLTQGDPGPIITKPEVIGATLDILTTTYANQVVNCNSCGREYLIGGVLVQPFGLANPALPDSRDGIDSIALIGESQTGIELLASNLRLPFIQQYNFLTRVAKH